MLSTFARRVARRTASASVRRRSTAASASAHATSSASAAAAAAASAASHAAPPAPAAAAGASPWESKSDAEVLEAVAAGRVRFFDLERQLGDMERAVRLRRAVVEQRTGAEGVLDELPYEHYDYARVHGQCCENVVGYVPIPVGVAGPLLVDGREYNVPMATTEGALIASVNRGSRALTMCGGVRTDVLQDGITRAPVVRVPSARVAAQIKRFCDEEFDLIADAFASTSRFARVESINVHVAGRLVFLRFRARTGDAMGMNMIGKGCDAAMRVILERFPAELLALSGNMCTDKKPSAINWIEGRGKSVVADAVIREEVVRDVLKSSVDGIVYTSYAKNLVGSAMAGSIGGGNAHAANMVAAVFLACGQDPAQVVESANCATLFEKTDEGDLYMSVTMPSIEVGTIGGGTILPGQSASLELLGVKGSNNDEPGANARQLARVIAANVMAGELSLSAALASGDLIKSHLALNRKK